MICAMKRIILLATLVAVGALSIGVAAFQQPPAAANAPKVVEVQKLRDNLFMLTGTGGGGNTAVFVRTDGITVVDTKNPGWGQPILDKIKELSNKPITTIINTHTHGDHVSGNVEFPTTVEVIVQENTKANMQEMRGPTGIAPPAGGAVNIFKANNGKGMPTKTFKDDMKVGKGPDEIDLFYYGRGHTNGDAWVVFPALRVVHAGDIFSGKNLPLLDANNGGSGVLIGETLAKAHQKLKNIDTIITGHSTTMTMADLAEYAEFNKDFMKDVQAAKKAGKSVDQIAASWKIPAKYKGYTDPASTPQQVARLKANIQIVFDETK
jgi:glyoxylase-like metal-dependent hydrolase (beta-lactamase superfamily II)